MKNLIKSNLYQTKKTRLWKVVFLIMLLMEIMLFTESVTDTALYRDGCKVTDFVVGDLSSILMLGMMFTLIVAPLIFGEDINDRTINYEIMKGHSRKEVFFSRLLVTLGITVSGSLLLTLLPLIVIEIMNGFGDKVSLGSILVKTLISILPIIRLTSEIVFFTVIVSNKYIGALFGFVFTEVSVVILENVGHGYMTSVNCLGTTTLLSLGSYKEDVIWRMSGSARDYLCTFSDAIEPKQYVLMAVITLIFTGIFAMLGYSFFKTEDMR